MQQTMNLAARVFEPSESQHEWDLYRLIATTSAEEAWRPLAEHACPLVKA